MAGADTSYTWLVKVGDLYLCGKFFNRSLIKVNEIARIMLGNLK